MPKTAQDARPAERHNDADLRSDHPAPAQSGSSGGERNRDFGKRDEARQATGRAPGVMRVEKKDKRQPDPATRADHKSAAG